MEENYKELEEENKSLRERINELEGECSWHEDQVRRLKDELETSEWLSKDKERRSEEERRTFGQIRLNLEQRVRSLEERCLLLEDTRRYLEGRCLSTEERSAHFEAALEIFAKRCISLEEGNKDLASAEKGSLAEGLERLFFIPAKKMRENMYKYLDLRYPDYKGRRTFSHLSLTEQMRMIYGCEDGNKDN